MVDAKVAVETQIVNNEPEVIDDIENETELTRFESDSMEDKPTSTEDQVSDDDLEDTEIGHHLGQLLTEIRRDGESSDIEGAGDEASETGQEADPFDPSEFSLDVAEKVYEDDAVAAERGESDDGEVASAAMTPSETLETAAAEEDEDVNAAISQAVTEIEAALMRYTQAERLRAQQMIAQRESQIAAQQRKLASLAEKVARQKVQIQEAKKELKAKLELADRLHIEFDGIRQVLNGKLGVLDELDKEEESSA